jgi:fructose-1,6-bisphosphatase/inositol monophosphatase family enzyme
LNDESMTSADVIGGLMLVEEAGGVASDFQDGAALDEQNHCYGATPGLAQHVKGLPGFGD